MLRDALRLIQSRGEPMTTVQVDRLIEALDRLTDATVEQTRCTIEATAAIIATVDDTCGNLLQLTQIARW